MEELARRLAGLELIVFDIDGVFTDGSFLLDAEGREYKSFHTQDGFGIRRLIEAGVEVAVISGRSSPAVAHRMAELGVAQVHQGCRDKVPRLESLATELGIGLERTAYVGDDIPDLGPMRACGVAIAVANAVPEVRSEAAHVTRRAGGSGAVREVADLVLEARAAGRST